MSLVLINPRKNKIELPKLSTTAAVLRPYFPESKNTIWIAETAKNIHSKELGKACAKLKPVLPVPVKVSQLKNPRKIWAVKIDRQRCKRRFLYFLPCFEAAEMRNGLRSATRTRITKYATSVDQFERINGFVDGAFVV